MSSLLENSFANYWRLLGLPIEPQREFVFHKTRKWRFDFAWPEQLVAIEIEGGTAGEPVICHQCGARVRARTAQGVGRELRLGGRHNRAQGMQGDAEKYNAAAVAGWAVLRYTADDLKRRPVQVIEEVTQALRGRKRRANEDGEGTTSPQLLSRPKGTAAG